MTTRNKAALLFTSLPNTLGPNGLLTNGALLPTILQLILLFLPLSLKILNHASFLLNLQSLAVILGFVVLYLAILFNDDLL